MAASKGGGPIAAESVAYVATRDIPARDQAVCIVPGQLHEVLYRRVGL
jgi:hypothetical protein